MARQAPKSKHVGFKLMISREEGKPGTWERVGFLFKTRFEAESFHWRYYRDLPRRVAGITLSVVPVESRGSADRDNGPRRPAA